MLRIAVVAVRRRRRETRSVDQGMAAVLLVVPASNLAREEDRCHKASSEPVVARTATTVGAARTATIAAAVRSSTSAKAVGSGTRSGRVVAEGVDRTGSIRAVVAARRRQTGCTQASP